MMLVRNCTWSGRGIFVIPLHVKRYASCDTILGAYYFAKQPL